MDQPRELVSLSNTRVAGGTSLESFSFAPKELPSAIVRMAPRFEHVATVWSQPAGRCGCSGAASLSRLSQ
jgi:hypothetical protein